jgi:hypothetical protein
MKVWGSLKSNRFLVNDWAGIFIRAGAINAHVPSRPRKQDRRIMKNSQALSG